jgi:hypothetical protein
MLKEPKYKPKYLALGSLLGKATKARWLHLVRFALRETPEFVASWPQLSAAELRRTVVAFQYANLPRIFPKSVKNLLWLADEIERDRNQFLPPEINN